MKEVSNAQVPIIKLRSRESGQKFDLVFYSDIAGSTKVALELTHKMPEVTPLTIFVKVFLKARNLNQVITAGISSYGMMLLVASHCQQLRLSSSEGLSIQEAQLLVKTNDLQEQAEECKESGLPLSLILLLFFKRYGFDLNSFKLGISEQGYVSKNSTRGDQWEIQNPENGDLLLVGRTSEIKTAFRFAFHALLSELKTGSGGCLKTLFDKIPF